MKLVPGKLYEAKKEIGKFEKGAIFLFVKRTLDNDDNRIFHFFLGPDGKVVEGDCADQEIEKKAIEHFWKEPNNNNK